LRKQYFVDANPKYPHEQSRQLRRDSATHVSDRVWQPVKLPVRKTFHHQLDPYEEEKDWNGKHDRIDAHAV